MKKFISILSLFLIVLTLGACQKEGTVTGDETTTTEYLYSKDAEVSFENTQTDNSYVISVLLDGQKVADLNQDWPADGYDASIFKRQNDYIYLAINPTGLGGFILYTGSQKIYQIDLKTGVTKELNFEGFATDISSDDSSLVSFYQDAEGLKVGVYDLKNDSSKSYTVDSNFYQAGEGLFSEDGKYLAYAATMAPNDMGIETANTTTDLITAIFVVDLTAQTQTEFARENYMVNIEGWDNNKPTYKVEKDAK